MSAFADECREKAARFAERAAGYRKAGFPSLANASRIVAISLANAANAMDAVDAIDPDRVVERLQA